MDSMAHCVVDVIVQNIFSPKASGIIRILLVSPEKEWGTLSLSEVAGTAYGHTYRAVKTLLKLGLCRKTGTNRIKVATSGELLNRWAAYCDFNFVNNIKGYFSMEKSLDSLLGKLPSTTKDDPKYALFKCRLNLNYACKQVPQEEKNLLSSSNLAPRSVQYGN